MTLLPDLPQQPDRFRWADGDLITETDHEHQVAIARRDAAQQAAYERLRGETAKNHAPGNDSRVPRAFRTSAYHLSQAFR